MQQAYLSSLAEGHEEGIADLVQWAVHGIDHPTHTAGSTECASFVVFAGCAAEDGHTDGKHCDGSLNLDQCELLCKGKDTWASNCSAVSPERASPCRCSGAFCLQLHFWSYRLSDRQTGKPLSKIWSDRHIKLHDAIWLIYGEPFFCNMTLLSALDISKQLKLGRDMFVVYVVVVVVVCMRSSSWSLK